jgi:hypothetical protein
MLRLVCMYDKKAEQYNSPISTAGIGQLARAIGEAVNSPEKSEIFAKHPSDFQLFEVGMFNEVTGEITPCKPTFLLDINSLAE